MYSICCILMHIPVLHKCCLCIQSHAVVQHVVEAHHRLEDSYHPLDVELSVEKPDNDTSKSFFSFSGEVSALADGGDEPGAGDPSSKSGVLDGCSGA